MFSEVDLNLKIISNVSYPVQINVLSNPYNLLDTSNSNTEYQYDLTSFIFSSETQVSIEYKPNGAASYATYSGQFTPQTLQAVVDVLNGLGIGFFSLYTSGGNTYIGTYNNDYTFGQLSIYDSASSQVSYQITQPNAGGSGLISSIFFSIIYTSPTTIPVTNIALITAGQTINISGTTDSIANTDVIITETNMQTFASNIISNNNYAPLTPFTDSLTTQAGYSYLIQILG